MILTCQSCLPAPFSPFSGTGLNPQIPISKNINKSVIAYFANSTVYWQIVLTFWSVCSICLCFHCVFVLITEYTPTKMDSASVGSSAAQKSHNLFQVYLRLRPPQPGAANADRFLSVEPPAIDAPSTSPTHVTLNPPNDRRRAIEKFAFTQVFEEDATQLDVFHCTNVVPLVEGVLAPHGGDGTDALLATLGVTGSGKVQFEQGTYLQCRVLKRISRRITEFG